MIFVTSDLHFGHKNIIQYENRPFLNPLGHNVGVDRNNYKPINIERIGGEDE